MNKPAPKYHDFLGEAEELLTDNSDRQRAFADDRGYLAAFWNDVVLDTVRDCVANFAKWKQTAFSAEACDREAVAVLDQLELGLADGRVDKADRTLLVKARKLVLRSAELDHDMAEAKV